MGFLNILLVSILFLKKKTEKRPKKEENHQITKSEKAKTFISQ